MKHRLQDWLQVTPGDPNALCPLATMSWKWPDIGSRVTREGHARFWERPEVKLLRATRQGRQWLALFREDGTGIH